MEKQSVTLRRDQLSALEGLAYWIQELAYLQERGDKEDPEYPHEEKRYRDTIGMIFDELDNKGVSFMLQNAVIFWAENWRDYMRGQTLEFLRTRFNVSLC